MPALLSGEDLGGDRRIVINWSRGVFRLWLVPAVIYAAYTTSLFDDVMALITEAWDSLGPTLGPIAVLLIVVLVFIWVAAGFRPTASKE